MASVLWGQVHADPCTLGIDPARYQVALDQHQHAVELQQRLLVAGQAWWSLQGEQAAAYAEADAQRFAALEALNTLLPVQLKADQLRHAIASQWLANWDHLNVFMENFGYAKKEAQLQGVTVDFGACGPCGFGGLPKAASHHLAQQQRPAALFAPPAAFVRAGKHFNTLDQASAALDDATQWPYGYQSQSVLAELERQPDVALEMGYRLQCLDERVVHRTLAQHWVMPPPSTQLQWPSAKQTTSALMRRRDEMVTMIGREAITQWSRTFADKAEQINQRLDTVNARSAYFPMAG